MIAFIFELSAFDCGQESLCGSAFLDIVEGYTMLLPLSFIVNG